MIFIIKVTSNKEERAVEMISDRVEKKNLNVFSVVRPHGLKGYIILEASDRESAEEAAFNLPYVKGIIGKTLQYDEIKNMLEPKVEDIVVALVDNQNTVKRYMRDQKGKIYLKAENPAYDNIYPEGELCIQGVVTGLLRYYKR